MTFLIFRAARSIKFLSLAVLASASAFAQTMREITEEKVRFAINEQLPVVKKLAQEGRVPREWAEEMQKTVMPLTIEAALALADVADQALAYSDYLGPIKQPSDHQLTTAIEKAIPIGELTRRASATYERYLEAYTSVHKKHKIPLPKSWATKQDRYKRAWAAGFSLGEVAREAKSQLPNPKKETMVKLDACFERFYEAYSEVGDAAALHQARIARQAEKFRDEK
jgi:hypothetical protein